MKIATKKQLKYWESLKGKIPHNKGKTNIEIYGKEKAKQISLNASKKRIGKKLTEEHKKKTSLSMKGKNKYKKSIEHKNKISKKVKENWKNGIYKNNNKNASQRMKNGQALKMRLLQKKTKISKAEKIMEYWLRNSGINFITQWKYKHGIADFYIPEINLVIECDGIYWHSKPDYIERDKKKKEYLKSIGIDVLSMNSETILRNGGIPKCLSI